MLTLNCRNVRDLGLYFEIFASETVGLLLGVNSHLISRSIGLETECMQLSRY